MTRWTSIALGLLLMLCPCAVGSTAESTSAAGPGYAALYDEYQETVTRMESAGVDLALRKQLTGKLRRYRIRLLDLQRKAVASDDDAEAAALQAAIDHVAQLILESEATLLARSSVAQGAMRALPGGLSEGLVLYYPFDEERDFHVTDSTVHENHGAVQGARWSRHGRRGGAYRFDGVDDYIYTRASASLRLAQELTLSICVFRQAADEGDQYGLQHLLSKGVRTRSDFWLYINAGGDLGAGLRHRADGATPLRIDTEPSRHRVGDGKWAHLVFTYDGRIARTYIDGRGDKAMLLPGGTGVADGSLNIGRMGNGQWSMVVWIWG